MALLVVVWPPETAPPRDFTGSGEAQPLCWAKVSRAPSGDVCMTAGSVVGSPQASISEPGGTASPLCRATRVLPKAIALVA